MQDKETLSRSTFLHEVRRTIDDRVGRQKKEKRHLETRQ